MTDTPWKNRIVRYGEQSADQFLAHPQNARRHPAAQRDALRGSFDALGIYAPVIIATSGYVIDGHARIEECLSRDDQMLIPFIEVDLSEDEEALALASFDWITQMATYDRQALDDLLQGVETDNAALDDLLQGVETDNAALQAMLSELAAQAIEVSWDDAFDKVPTEDRSPFQQMTFTLHDDQIETVKRALFHANGGGAYDTVNENSNGNALARICEAYLNGR